jgi:hypothetical protein
MGPVFRFGRNPTLRLFLSRKIADMGIRAMARNYSNEPSTVLGHFGMKFRLLSHLANMRHIGIYFQLGSLRHNQTDLLPERPGLFQSSDRRDSPQIPDSPPAFLESWRGI